LGYLFQAREYQFHRRLVIRKRLPVFDDFLYRVGIYAAFTDSMAFVVRRPS
jgi:hypothetical protein